MLLLLTLTSSTHAVGTPARATLSLWGLSGRRLKTCCSRCGALRPEPSALQRHGGMSFAHPQVPLCSPFRITKHDLTFSCSGAWLSSRCGLLSSSFFSPHLFILRCLSHVKLCSSRITARHCFTFAHRTSPYATVSPSHPGAWMSLGCFIPSSSWSQAGSISSVSITHGRRLECLALLETKVGKS
jgi:hypothetical protein